LQQRSNSGAAFKSVVEALHALGRVEPDIEMPLGDIDADGDGVFIHE